MSRYTTTIARKKGGLCTVTMMELPGCTLQIGPVLQGETHRMVQMHVVEVSREYRERIPNVLLFQIIQDMMKVFLH
jgi:hypothetical protein